MNKYSPIITDGITYGFLLSCFVWGIFYFKAEIEYYYHPEYHYKPFLFNFFPLVLILIISSLLARIIVKNLNTSEREYSYWLKTISITYVIFYAVIFFYETYLIASTTTCDSCSFPKSLGISINIEVLLLLLLLFGLFTPVYGYVKESLLKIILKS